MRLLLSLVLFACSASEPIAPSDQSDWRSLAERPCPDRSDLTYENFGQPFFLGWCTGCHSSALTGDQRAGAPAGVDFDTIDGIRTHADRIWSKAGDQNVAMPPAGGPTAGVREELGDWLACGAPSTGSIPPPTIDPSDGGIEELDSGVAPAMFSDTGEYATPSTEGMAFCGPAPCMTSTSTCCIKESGPECTAAPSGCALTIGCDGPEDCPGRSCCLRPTEAGPVLACADACGESSVPVCHTADECPDEQPVCCSFGPPFGHCTVMEGAGPGELCDLR